MPLPLTGQVTYIMKPGRRVDNKKIGIVQLVMVRDLPRRSRYLFGMIPVMINELIIYVRVKKRPDIMLRLL